ncbi:alpha/beta hydrolase [Streptomyces sp. Ru71]|uniref:alpha/beta hydrolase n=1 Tax=Streptomyces sp. Ru71 TaxID=2080746 RepID=UPI000CDD8751|nr:alpha/beta fold hydrolase [Streptomyces sp. Ru71]POX48533.1 alpha/beta hydrolase [Streptomyces sp. Ru71]
MRRITVAAGPLTLSGLQSDPPDGPPRALVVALHGGGMSAGYFDGQAHPDLSLLTLGAHLGYRVVALDRPGYGASAAQLPAGRTLAEQAADVAAAVRQLASAEGAGGGVLLLAHSFAGKLAFLLAAEHAPDDLLGLDVSGCGTRLAVPPEQVRQGRSVRRLNWGPLSLYPSGTFQASATVVAPMPEREVDSVGAWERLSAEMLPGVRVPVRLTFAEHEAWWRHGDEDVADVVGRLAAAPRVVVDRMPGAGHNISLGWAARTYHLRVFAFVEECLRGPGRPAASHVPVTDAGP